MYIDDVLAQQGDKDVSISIREHDEVLDPSKPKEARTSRVFLYMAFKGCDKPLEVYLGRVLPEQRNLRKSSSANSDIDYFTEDEHIPIKKGPATDILTRLFSYFSRMDPRITGKDEAQPRINITHVGGKPYDPAEVSEIYTRTQIDRKQRTRESGKLREFLSFGTGFAFNH